MSGPVTPAPDDARLGVDAGDRASIPSGDEPAEAGAASGATPTASAPSDRRRYALGLLSAVVPGLGHLVQGRARLGALFIAPVVGAVAIVAYLAATTDRAQLLAYLVDPAILTWLLAIEAAILVWRLLAMGSAMWGPRPARTGPAVLVVGLLLAFAVLPQVYAGYVTNVARETADAIFQPAGAGIWRPSPSPGPATPAPTFTSGAPLPSPSPSIPRITVLLIGMDSGVGRQTALTDTMIVASLDRVGRTVSMISVPRDLVDAPLPGGGVFHPKINSLVTYAQLHPGEFPGSNGNGQAVLAGTLGELLGVPIDYWAQVNLGGFLRVVDTVGGVDVDVAHGFCDPGYDEYGQKGFAIAAGRWHLNGSQALAYARVRKATGESDFTRAARQQEVLVGLRDALARGGFLSDPIGFLQAIGRSVLTNVPPSMLPELAKYAEDMGRSRVYRAVIEYPLVHPSAVADPRGSIQIPDLAAIRALAARAFPDSGMTPSIASAGGSTPGPGTSSPSGPARRPASTTCIAAPTPAPTPRPSASPQASSSGGAAPSPSDSAEPSGSPGNGNASASPSHAVEPPAGGSARPTASASPAAGGG